jgi:hypothetical protein
MSEVRVSCEVAEVLSLVPHVEVWSSLTNYVGDRVVDPRLPPMKAQLLQVITAPGIHIRDLFAGLYDKHEKSVTAA